LNNHEERPRLLVLLAAALTAAAVPLVLRLTERSTLQTLTREDGVVEYGTALMYATAGVLFALTAARRDRSRAWPVVFAVLFLLIAGEELNWGQRLLGLEPPDSLRDANVQEEINLHNIEGLNDHVRFFGVTLFSALYVALPAGVRLSSRLASVVDRLRLPVPGPWSAAIAGGAVLAMAIPRLMGEVFFAVDEVGELYYAIAAALFGLVVQRAKGLDPPAPAGP
jgi:hypothetical protein